jgi:hypothetical protein
MRVIETPVFQFDELADDSAKESARDWFRECLEYDEISDTDDWESIAEILGVTFAYRPVRLMGGGTRQEPQIHWSGFYSQGDGASWEGSYEYAKRAPRRIRAYAPRDADLHAIADRLQEIQRRNGYRLTARVTTSGRYSHSGTMDVETSKGDSYLGNGWNYGLNRDADDTAAEIRDALRAFADWIYRQLEAQWEYLNSAESVDESIRANEYTFTADGARFG